MLLDQPRPIIEAMALRMGLCHSIPGAAGVEQRHDLFVGAAGLGGIGTGRGTGCASRARKAHQVLDGIARRILADVQRHQFGDIAACDLVGLRIADGASQPHQAGGVLNVVAAEQCLQRRVDGLHLIRRSAAFQPEPEVCPEVWRAPGHDGHRRRQVVFLQDGVDPRVVPRLVEVGP